MNESTENKIVFDVRKTTPPKVGSVVRINARAQVALEEIMIDTGLSACEIVSKFIEYGASHYEVIR